MIKKVDLYSINRYLGAAGIYLKQTLLREKPIEINVFIGKLVRGKHSSEPEQFGQISGGAQ